MLISGRHYWTSLIMTIQPKSVLTKYKNNVFCILPEQNLVCVFVTNLKDGIIKMEKIE